MNLHIFYSYIQVFKTFLTAMEVSKSVSTLNHSSGNNLKMKELIKAINEYLTIKTENTAFVIKKFLQVCIQ